MSLIRLIFSALLAVSICCLPTFAHAAETLAAGHPEETLALNLPMTDMAVPEFLPSARDIKIELLPLAPESLPHESLAPAAPGAQQSSQSDSVQSIPSAQDLWTRIRNGFAMRELNSKLDSRLIANHEKWYARHPEYVLRMSERARRYLFYIVEEVERRGIPSEIALLPIIESAFNPGANSVASASGIWQFIPSTGKHFGMEQNWWYDGRRDITGATNGALNYLQKLHDQFGDWELALAAYNWGENAVARAQANNRRRGKPTDYASLTMPRETRNYVPKLMAIKNIVSDPSRFGLILSDIPDEPYFEAVAASQHIDVKVAAELANISMDEFIALNPGHNRPVILQNTSDVLLLPIDKVETFRSNLAKADQRLVSWQPYQSRKGEQFEHIAARFGLTMAALSAANGFSKYAQESNGQTLLVPILDEEPAAEFAAFNMHPSAAQEMFGAVRYTVRRGDTISTIARRFNVSQAQLREANRGKSLLRVGQRFNIVLSDRNAYRKRGLTTNKVKKANTRKVASMKVAYNTHLSLQSH